MELFDRFPKILIVFAITLRKEETFRMFLDACSKHSSPRMIGHD